MAVHLKWGCFFQLAVHLVRSHVKALLMIIPVHFVIFCYCVITFRVIPLTERLPGINGIDKTNKYINFDNLIWQKVSELPALAVRQDLFIWKDLKTL